MKDEVAMTLNISESAPSFSSSHLNAVTIKCPPQVERYGIRACNREFRFTNNSVR